ncbi:MAG: M56 family metallopeptidase [Armatimonadota bacterium]
MQAWNLLVTIAGQHLLPALLASALIWAALALLFGPGRVRRPAYRVVFLYAALLKVMVATWQGEGISCLKLDPAPLRGYLAFSLPNVIGGDRAPLESGLVRAVVATSDFSSRVLATVLVLALGFCVYRWVRIAPIYRRMHIGTIVAPERFPRVHRAFGEIVTRAWQTRCWQPRPQLVVVHDAVCLAFTMGIVSPVVVISGELAEQLGEPELRGVLAHEVAHVRRFDYVGRWFATVMRDLMVWNPAATAWYRQLVNEQEKASDEYAAFLLQNPGAVASGLVEVAAYAVNVPLTSIGPLAAWRAGDGVAFLEARVDHLEEVASSAGLKPQWQRALGYLLFSAFLMLQPHIVMPLVWWLGQARRFL